MQNAAQIDHKSFNMETVGVKTVKKITRATIKDLPSDEKTENQKIVENCMMYWLSLSDFRKRRQRSRMYYRGDQWGEYMDDPDTGETITEEQHILRQGKMPLKQNVIRQLVKNILGQWRSNRTKSRVNARTFEGAGASDVLTNALQAALDINSARELDAKSLEEFLLSGVPIQKVGYKLWKDRDTEDVYIQNVNPNRLFFNSDVEDIRLHDIRLIGMIIDSTMDEIVSAFARNKADEEKIKSYYREVDERVVINFYGLRSQRIDSLTFLVAEPGKYRVIETWRQISKWRVYAHDWADGTYKITKRTLNEIEAENQWRIAEAAKVGIPAEQVLLIEAREQLDQFWEVRYLTPLGDELYRAEDPFYHGSHPFSFMLHPLLDGEVWGFVEDIIDQQRYINRLISMLDFIIGASAKGVLLVHEDSIPQNMTEADFAAEWTKFGGVIKYKGKPGVPAPQQVAANSVNIGAGDLLAVQMKLMNEISGVHGAIQGQAAGSGKPASLYAQEAQNATLNILEYMERFADFRKERDTKALKLIQQYYTEKRHLLISGADYERNATEYDPEEVRNAEWEIQVSQSADSTVYRQMLDETLFSLLNMQAIDVEMFLENSSLPYSEKLLDSIREKRQEMSETGRVPEGGIVPPEMEQQVMGDTNPKALELMNKAMAV